MKVSTNELIVTSSFVDDEQQEVIRIRPAGVTQTDYLYVLFCISFECHRVLAEKLLLCHMVNCFSSSHFWLNSSCLFYGLSTHLNLKRLFFFYSRHFGMS